MPSKLLSYLRLCRIPTVFTALADIFAGYLLTHTDLQPHREFLLLLLASAGLYLAGMVLNDLFDVEQDTRERPRRPIPSGQVSRRNAAYFGFGLMGIGLGAAAGTSLPSLLIGLILAVCILGYDRFLKRTPLGPLAMGSCRLLNILLGASSGVADFASLWQSPQLAVACAMGLYITGVTWFARTEARDSNRQMLLGALVTVNAGLVWLFTFPAAFQPLVPAGSPPTMGMALLIWSAVAFLVNRRAVAAIRTPSPALVQPTIGIMLLSVIGLNTMTILSRLGEGGVRYAIGTLLLIPPAILLRRRIAMT
ncbi:UbiA family prenyltransferase [Planctomicrobium sp. SH664]|uniref:UbiA family prenyltransferase n=1 Tax=Planctomicrobium sp. SH664 TaxID=3448125 RepID=UPI003F5B1436